MAATAETGVHGLWCSPASHLARGPSASRAAASTRCRHRRPESDLQVQPARVERRAGRLVQLAARSGVPQASFPHEFTDDAFAGSVFRHRVPPPRNPRFPGRGSRRARPRGPWPVDAAAAWARNGSAQAGAAASRTVLRARASSHQIRSPFPYPGWAKRIPRNQPGPGTADRHPAVHGHPRGQTGADHPPGGLAGELRGASCAAPRGPAHGRAHASRRQTRRPRLPGWPPPTPQG